ncbi:flagellin [Cereibacter sediminicola]|uniref:flagellin N-terminal helical domain-containing protein n=1 Tax=Cereibacter sediminicola TaxID=2584941 RepID=UPI00119CA4E9|nr:flagellin [Cereibacter sediminicola]
MSSILTNTSAMVALQTLKSINSGLAKTQDEISTGKSIGSAKDGAAIWSVSKVMQADVAMFEAVSESLGVGEATTKVALSGIEQLTKTLNEIEKLVVAATSEGADTTAIESQITSLKEKMDSVVAGSQVNGINLLNENPNGTDATYNVVSSVTRASPSAAASLEHITITGTDLEADVTGITFTGVADTTDAAATLGEIETMRTAILTAGATLGAAAAQIADQKDFVSKVADGIKVGISVMTDTDMEAASARLQALQVQQQLATQSLSIANQAPQNILSLFR